MFTISWYKYKIELYKFIKLFLIIRSKLIEKEIERLKIEISINKLFYEIMGDNNEFRE